jgi:hypothetical protein
MMARTSSLSMPLLLALLASGVAAVLVALAPSYIAILEGRYIPVGTDSWYHARRILDMIADPTSFHEFDRLIHVPEGSLLVWPWGYDYAMSLIARAALALGLSDDPVAVLDHVPVFAFLLMLTLMLVICRQLGLSVAATALALFATALFPLNQALYAVGNIDHHFAEHLLVIGSVAAGLGWQRRPDSLARACCAGVVLGIAPAIHNGLFILQLAVVLGFGWAWLRRLPVPANSWAFGVTLFVCTLAVATGSTALREGEFEFYILSWFHVYIAFCTGAILTVLSKVAPSPKNIGILAGVAIVMAIPAISQALLGERFLSATVIGMAEIAETQSFWAIGENGKNLMAMYRYGTGLLLLLPLTAALCIWRLWREPSRAVFWCACLIGLALLATQVRLHYFGSFALFLPLIVWIDERASKLPLSPALVHVALAAVLLLCYAPGLKFTLMTKKITGNDPYFALTYDIYPSLTSECERKPGITLSHLDDANYVRYYTRCSIIANNFLLTPQQERKVLEVRALFALSAAELLRSEPEIRYVYVRRSSLFLRNEAGGLNFNARGFEQTPDPPLVQELLAASPDSLPPGYRLVKELAFEKPSHIPFARIFALERPQ